MPIAALDVRAPMAAAIDQRAREVAVVGAVVLRELMNIAAGRSAHSLMSSAAW